MALTQPSFIPEPWAETSQTFDTIPATQQETGRASWADGFPQENTIPVSQGGTPANYLDFQGVLHALSSFAWWQQRGGLFQYSNQIDYPVGAIVIDSGGMLYQCIAENGPGTSAGAKQLSNTTFWMQTLQLSYQVIGRKTLACIYFGSAAIAPSVDDGTASDNAINLGQGNRRWATVFAGTGSINTSDERVKRDVSGYSDEVLDAWGDVQWKQFRFNDSYAEKGESARIHSGLIAQRIAEVFDAHELDASRYGFFCHDAWGDEDGGEAGDSYALRYDECLAIEAAYQRRRADRLESRIAAIEERLNALDGDLR